MRPVFVSILAFLFSNNIFSQQLPQINFPLVDTLNYIISDSVFVATTGDDTNPGTRQQPVKTFSKAIQLLPFGVAGINNGHAYGVVIILEGNYDQSFIQTGSQWKNGNVYKNVSVRGEGEVIIGGTAAAPLTNQLMYLRGSHIYVKNVKLRYGNIIGLLISGEAQNPRTASDIIIKNVEVDSMASHGMLIRYCENVLADNVTVKHANGYEPSVPPFPCGQWPSGFKAYMSKHVTIKNSTVIRNWGEGINFHNCENGLMENCFSGDNYATNFYSDNSSKLILRNSIIYNSPGVKDHWRACYGYENAPLAASAISIANERSCPTSNGYITNHTINCATECVNAVTGNFLVPQSDSIFIYNNILLNCGGVFSIWDGVTGSGTSCFSNIFAVHNTCIGYDSDSAISNKAMVNFSMTSGINILNQQPLTKITSSVFAQNIFSFDTLKNFNVKILRRNLDNLFPAPFEVDFHRNLWKKNPDAFGMDSTSVVAYSLLTTADTGNINTWQAQLEPYLIEGIPFDFASYDFFGQPRNNWYCGAIESPILTSAFLRSDDALHFNLFPNPANTQALLLLDESYAKQYIQIHITDLSGKVLKHFTLLHQSSLIIQMQDMPSGMYLVNIQSEKKLHTLKLLKP